jgi:hypothetical protein
MLTAFIAPAPIAGLAEFGSAASQSIELRLEGADALSQRIDDRGDEGPFDAESPGFLHQPTKLPLHRPEVCVAGIFGRMARVGRHVHVQYEAACFALSSEHSPRSAA